MIVRKRWLLAVAALALGASMSLAIACSDDDDNGTDGGDEPTATQAMDETPSETMGHEETPEGTAMNGETPMDMGEGEIHIYEQEYQITGEDGPVPTAAAGEVVFEVHNDGELEHDLIIIKTELAEDALPQDGETVDEDSADIEIVGRVDAIPADDAEVLSVDLEAGDYVLICNVVGHYALGMHATLTVQ